jgi:hypothetical protein
MTKASVGPGPLLTLGFVANHSCDAGTDDARSSPKGVAEPRSQRRNKEIVTQAMSTAFRLQLVRQIYDSDRDMDPDEAFQRLGLTPGATEDEI